MRVLVLLAVIAAAACGGSGGRARAPGAAHVPWTCEVRLDDGLDRVQVRTCFSGKPSGWLEPADSEGRDLLDSARVVGPDGTRAADVGPGGVRLDDVRAGECVLLRLALPDRPARFVGTTRVGGDVLVSPRTLLWAPQGAGAAGGVTLTLQLPAGVHASVPWPRVGPSRYHLDATALRWRSFAAFGRFATDRIDLPGGFLDVSRLGGHMAASTEGTRRWLSAAAGGLVSLLGTMPAPRIQVLILPAPGAGEPVFFGATGRGGGAGIVLFASALATDAELMDDWVAPHELVHFALPTVPDTDAWFSEGLATYYQEVLRARVGTRTARRAWAELADGFARGRASASGRTLAEESATMHRWRAYQRVYWGGAAIALLADEQIRRGSQGRASLDSAVREIAACCLQDTTAQPAEALLARVSAASGGDALRRIAARALASAAMPEVDDVLERLGVRRTADGGVELDPNAPGAWIRDAITAPVPAADAGPAR